MPILKSINFENLTQIGKEIFSSKLTNNIKRRSTKQDIELSRNQKRIPKTAI